MLYILQCGQLSVLLQEVSNYEIMDQQEYIQLKAFARIDGAILGAVWIVSFALCIAGMKYPGLSLSGTLIALASPFVAVSRLVKFRDYALNGVISFGRSMAYYILLFFYASLLMALAQYIYFAYLDNGFVVSYYVNTMNLPEARQMVTAAGMTGKDIDNVITQMRETTPIMLALNIMTMNITIGVMLSPLVALMTKRSVRKA